MSHMVDLDPSTHVAFYNIVSGLVLHLSPPKLLFQIMIHIRVAEVGRIFGCMSFIKNLLT
jgi:hypothetical protein